MAIIDVLDDAKARLHEIKRKYKFKQARKAREQAVDLQVALAECRGKLETCRKDLNRTIKTQSRNIGEGVKEGADTIIQEQILWDAAIGYMLVRDAIFALKTINSHDSVSHAYDMLDAAVKQMSVKKSGGFKPLMVHSEKDRNAYGYINSGKAVKEKEEMLDTFFEQLKVTGDIDECLAGARNPAARQADLRRAYTQGSMSSELNTDGAVPDSEMDELMGRLSAVPGEAGIQDDFSNDLADMMDIHPPVDAL